ncbi:hypothetical protein GQX74_004791 [Glossina fuscipes]|nr:hypothetical protein GQX74_004791 [Glossina fuscipes]
MSNLRSVIFYDLCRVCTSSSDQRIDIFSAEGKSKNLCNKIAECLPINVDEKDRLPKVLCPQCAQHVETFIEFRNICRNSQTKLTSWLNAATGQNFSEKLAAKNENNNKNQSSAEETTPSINTISISTPNVVQQQQPVITIQNSNQNINSSMVPISITASAPNGQLQVNNEFLNSIMQVVGMQVEKPVISQCSVTVDNVASQSQQQEQPQLQQQCLNNKEKELKNSAVLQSPALTSASTTSSTIFSPNKCFLPITIKDENTDQQFVAHIDAKNFLLPTTYQLQMKLQPQIATADGQPIMQLAPTSIPATLQLTPQTLTSAPTFQAATVTTLNQNHTIPTQINQPQQQQQQQIQIQTTPSIGPTRVVQQLAQQQQQHQITQQPQSQQQSTSLPLSTSTSQPQPKQQQQQQQQQQYQIKQPAKLSKNVQITAQQIVNAGNNTNFTNENEVDATNAQTAQPMHNKTLQEQSASKAQITQIQTNTFATLQTSANSTTSASSSQEFNTKFYPLQITQPTSSPNEQPTASNVHQSTTTLRISPTKKVIIKKTQKSEISSTMPHKTQPEAAVDANPASTPASAKYVIKNITPTTTTPTSTNQIKLVGTTTTTTPSATNSTTSSTTTTATKTTSQSVSAQNSNSLECPTCHRAFKKKEHLTQHFKLHAGVRPFKCTETGCNKAFSRKEHLHRHLISHTGKKMFSCDLCQKPFSRKDNLSKHRKTHYDNAISIKYCCEICNKSFASKSYYEQHKQHHQKANTEAEVTRYEN